MEFFGWRKFRNRREVGGLAGLSPTPYQSGDESHDQGISKACNQPIRAMAIEIAWGWLRYQPESALSQWYQEHYAEGSKRLRKIGIVALARKLLVALWRYVETGEIPAGAELKATESPAEAQQEIAENPARSQLRAAESPAGAERKADKTPAKAPQKAAKIPAGAQLKVAEIPAGAQLTA
jgi:hypothetical protein